MKQLLVIYFVIGLWQVTMAQTSISASDLKKVSWLGGNWVRTKLKPGRTGAENWKRLSTGEWRGLGFMLQGSDTLFVERMGLVIFENMPAFVADVPENKA